MAYSHTTLADLNDQLARRLDDSSKVFWVNAELNAYLQEALETWNAFTGFRRDRGTFSTTAGTAFYALQSQATLAPLLSFTKTDSSLVGLAQYHLLEASTGISWTGTDMFGLDDVIGALQNRRDQFLADTGIVLTSGTQPIGPAPPVGRVSLADSVIDVRRLVWQPATGSWRRLWREGEQEFTSFDTSWATDPGDPGAYSILATRPVDVQLSPHPSSSGTMHLVTVSSGSVLDPTAGVVMGIPDDWCWAIKWGALADLLGKDGQARDPQRSAYCEDRYRQAVELARIAPSVVHSEINGVALIPSALHDLDAFSPGWEGQKRDRPTDIAVAGHNLVALRPVPDGVYSVTLDVVRKTGTLAGSNQVQLGREQLDAVLDYAEHLAAFKMAGAEFAATAKHLERFLVAAKTYNQRITASAPRSITSSLIAVDDMRREPRMLEGKGVGTLA